MSQPRESSTATASLPDHVVAALQAAFKKDPDFGVLESVALALDVLFPENGAVLSPAIGQSGKVALDAREVLRAALSAHAGRD